MSVMFEQLIVPKSVRSQSKKRTREVAPTEALLRPVAVRADTGSSLSSLVDHTSVVEEEVAAPVQTASESVSTDV